MRALARPPRLSELDIPLQAIQHRMALDNPWWRPGHGIDPEESAWPRRAHFARFARRLHAPGAPRVMLLGGPRRVGKTVFLKHLVADLLARGTPAADVLFLPLDTPLYAAPPLAGLLDAFLALRPHETGRPLWLLADEVQYQPDWWAQLALLLSRHPGLRVVASGSAAAADATACERGVLDGGCDTLVLPPLSFAEHLRFAGIEADLVRPAVPGRGEAPAAASLGCAATEIHALNTEFLHYLNYGGFPEAVMSAAVRDTPQRFLRQEIVDKVLLKDLPGLAGIGDTRALNRVFSVLAWYTGAEIGLEELSRQTGVPKLKLAEHLGYLEAAGLIRRVYRLDDDAARMQRERTFKVHLTNPSLRAALFGLAGPDDPAMPRLVATALWSQWLHATADAVHALHYMRWKAGRQMLDVELVSLDAATQRPRLAVALAWDDTTADGWRGLRALAQRHPMPQPPRLLTRTRIGIVEADGVTAELVPAALHCYALARRLHDDAD